MMQGKNQEEIKQTVINLAKNQGIDINQFANQFGIRL